MQREGHTFLVKDARAGCFLNGLINPICKSDKTNLFLCKLYFSCCACQPLLLSGNWIQLGPNRTHCLHDTGQEANWLFHFSSYISYTCILIGKVQKREAAIIRTSEVKIAWLGEVLVSCICTHNNSCHVLICVQSYHFEIFSRSRVWVCRYAIYLLLLFEFVPVCLSFFMRKVLQNGKTESGCSKWLS